MALCTHWLMTSLGSAILESSRLGKACKGHLVHVDYVCTYIDLCEDVQHWKSVLYLFGDLGISFGTSEDRSEGSK